MPAAKRIGLWLGGAAVAAGAIALVIAVRGDRPTGEPAVDPGDRARAADPRRAMPRPSGPAVSRGEPAPAADAERPHAFDPDETDPAKVIASARTEAASGRYHEAFALFQHAYELDQDPATLFEVGRMAHLTTRCNEARRITLRVLAASPGDALARKAQQLLDEIGRCD